MIEDLIVACMSVVILVVARFFALEIPYIDVGFHCDEDDIAFPVRPDTIPARTMYIIYSAIIFVVVPLSELSLYRKVGGPVLHVQWRRFKGHPLILKTLYFYVCFVCGVLATAVATEIFKRTSSRLRPNFLDTCKPANLSQLCPPGSHQYVEHVNCLGESSPDEHFSFPSSHASQSLYFAVFTISYLHRRMKFWAIVRAFAEYAIMVLAGFVCLSRVRDFKHRYTDVVGGAILGVLIGYGMIHLILYNFRKYRYRPAVGDVECIDGGPTLTEDIERRRTDYGTTASTDSLEHLVE